MRTEFSIQIVLPHSENLENKSLNPEELERIKLEMVLACSRIIEKTWLPVKDCRINVINPSHQERIK